MDRLWWPAPWSLIRNSSIPMLSTTLELVDLVEARLSVDRPGVSQIYLVKPTGGCGASTMLRQCALALARAHWAVVVAESGYDVWLPLEGGPTLNLSALANACQGHLVIVADDAHLVRVSEQVVPVLRQAQDMIVVVVGVVHDPVPLGPDLTLLQVPAVLQPRDLAVVYNQFQQAAGADTVLVDAVLDAYAAAATAADTDDARHLFTAGLVLITAGAHTSGRSLARTCLVSGTLTEEQRDVLYLLARASATALTVENRSLNLGQSYFRDTLTPLLKTAGFSGLLLSVRYDDDGHPCIVSVRHPVLARALLSEGPRTPSRQLSSAGLKWSP